MTWKIKHAYLYKKRLSFVFLRYIHKHSFCNCSRAQVYWTGDAMDVLWMKVTGVDDTQLMMRKFTLDELWCNDACDETVCAARRRSRRIFSTTSISAFSTFWESAHCTGAKKTCVYAWIIFILSASSIGTDQGGKKWRIFSWDIIDAPIKLYK